MYYAKFVRQKREDFDKHTFIFRNFSPVLYLKAFRKNKLRRFTIFVWERARRVNKFGA